MPFVKNKRLSTRSILNKKLIRQTLSGWKQFLSIIAMGGIAMTLFVGLLSNSESLSNRVEAFYEQGSLPSMWVLTKSYEPDLGESLKFANALEKEDQVDSRFQITAKLNSFSCYGAIVSGKPTLSKPIEMVQEEKQEDGGFFYIDKGISVLDDANKDPELKLGGTVNLTYQVGSYLPGFSDILDSLYESNPEYFLSMETKEDLARGNFTCKARITGLMTFPENIQSAHYYSSTYLMSKSVFLSSLHEGLCSYFTAEGREAIESYLGIDLQNVPTPNSFPQDNELLIKLKDPSTQKEKEERIKRYFQDHETFGESNLLQLLDRSLNPWSSAVDTEVLEATQLTFVFPFVFFFVALLVILTTLSQIILKERIQIGTMKALGLSEGQIYFHYFSLTLTLVSIGTLIGFILGPLIIPTIMGMKYGILYTLPPRSLFVFPLWQAFAAYFVFAAASVLVSWVVLRKEVKLSPSESMRAEVVSFKKKKLESDRKKTPLSLSLSMAFRNIRVNKLKSAMVVAGVFGCTALLLCGFGIEDTLDKGIENDLDMFYSASLTVSYASSRTGESDLLSYSGKIEDIQQYGSYTTDIVFNGKSMSSTFRLFEDEHPYFKKDLAGKGAVTVSSKLTEELGVREGDIISFSFDNRQIEAKVGKVIEAFAVNGVFGYFSDPLFEIAEPAYTGAWVQAKDGFTPQQLQADLNANCPYLSVARTKQDTLDQINSVMNGIRIMTNAVKVFAILLALVVLYNLALLNFRERSRDIATLKVLGFSKGEIALSLIVETLSLTALGIFLGFFAGWPFMYAVLAVNRVPLVKFLYTVAPISYLYAFLLTFLTSFLVNLYLSMMTGKIKMVESLKSVE